MDLEPSSLQDVWFVIFFGLLPIFLYLVILTGLIKSWYILAPLPGLLSGAMVYALAPIGLAFITLALSSLFPTADPTHWNIWDLPFFVFIGMGLLFMVWQPPWLKPRWVRWLEYEYGYCLDILIAEARQMGRWAWEEQVRTRAGMERWAQDVVARHKKEIDERWEYERKCRLAPTTPAAFRRGGFAAEDWTVPDIPEHRRAQEEARLKQIEEEMRQFQQEG